MRIAVGSDHAGFHMKQALASHLRELGHEVVDCGTHSEERVDYPDFGAAVGRAVAGGDAEAGVCVCGSGIGIAMAANKIAGIRAATVHDATSARLAREHNDANAISLGQRLLSIEQALEIVDIWLETQFQGGRHIRRIRMIDDPRST